MEPLSLEEAGRRFGPGHRDPYKLLGVVGAGPKALATAAKSQVLRELGFDAPRVVVVEAHDVGANWTATGGRTNGRPRLSTSPEKDLGFPYASDVYGPLTTEVNARMQRFSWAGYLVSRGEYATWVDSGRPSPRHSTWAGYLRWAADRMDFPLVRGLVSGLEIAGDRWEVTVDGPEGEATRLYLDQMMISGPGPHDGLLPGDATRSVEEFWRLGLDTDAVEPSVAVVGGGETAATIVEYLTHQHAGPTTVISPQPVVYSRGEGYFENALYSSPERWRELSERDRRDVIARTDRGVFSPRAIGAITTDARVEHQQGTVVSLDRVGDQTELVLSNPGRADRVLRFDVVIDATGARPDWFLDLFGTLARKALYRAVGDGTDGVRALERRIGEDLALDGISPRLLLPTLAGYEQGPGFANLSSLGLLSDRVLGATREGKAVAAVHGRGAAAPAPVAGVFEGPERTAVAATALRGGEA
ncbi:SidA/IucD/PvdA family monooxygenase [Streptomyces sp. NPDC020965]|uniref:SidA/IucD/PvdA family monooxygenase n=1 Tax=Streptomyces sp. NPDC020965 TaxID=3365105 RepID=UPI0037915263